MHPNRAAIRAATLLVASLAAQTAAAQAADPPTVSEAEFLAPLLAGHPALVLLDDAADAARARLVAARVLDDPEVAVAYEEPGTTRQVELTVAWRPPHPTRRRLAVAAAESDLAAALLRGELDRTSFALGLGALYARWAVAEARVARLAAHGERLAALAERERHRVAAGEAAGLDARRLELSHGEIRAELATASGERDLARAAALAWRDDLPPATRPRLPDPPDLPAPAETLAPLLVGVLAADVETARRERDLARQVIAMPEVVAGWQRQETPGETLDGTLLGLQWTVPVFDRNRAERLAAAQRLESATARLAIAERELAAEARGRRLAYDRLRDAAATAAATAATADAAVAAAEAAFRLGEGDLTALLETTRSALTLELAALDLRAEALGAHRELARLGLTADATPTPDPAGASELAPSLPDDDPAEETP